MRTSQRSASVVFRAGALAVVAAVGLSGCGEATDVVGAAVGGAVEQALPASPNALVDGAIGYANTAGSVEVVMKDSGGGFQSTIVRSFVAGSNNSRTVVTDGASHSTEVLVVDGVTYTRVASAGVGDVWTVSQDSPIEMPDYDSAMGGSEAITTFSGGETMLSVLSMLKEQTDADPAAGITFDVSEQEYQGQQAYAMKNRVAPEAGVFYFSTEADHRLLGYTLGGEGAGGSMDVHYTWNQVGQLLAPPVN